ncbi:MAG TPA: helix-turn-helix transcriptional regulator [Micromonosporaceae bacterium]
MTDRASGKHVRLTDQVAEEIRALLARRRISGRELARRLGESASWVNYRLTGHTPIGLDDMQRIAEELEVGIIDLLPEHARQGTMRHILSPPGRPNGARPAGARRPPKGPHARHGRLSGSHRPVRLPVVSHG